MRLYNSVGRGDDQDRVDGDDRELHAEEAQQ